MIFRMFLSMALFMMQSSGNAHPYDARFSAYSDVLNDFAKKHNLVVEKYYHDAPMWSLGFTHPQGGQSKLDFSVVEDGELSLALHWWLDDFESFTRYSNYETVQISESESLRDHLDRGLKTILGWQKGEWMRKTQGYEMSWKYFTAQDIENFNNKWPKVIP